MLFYFKPRKKLIIYGAGGHATSLASVALAAGHQIAFFIDKNRSGSFLFGTEVKADLQGLKLENYNFAIAIGDNFTRNKMYNELYALDSRLNFPALIHPSAVIGTQASVGAGSVLMPQVVVGPATKIGKFCIMNTSSAIDHDSEMQDFSSLAPGAITGGKVVIGVRSAISLNATIKHSITIGQDVVVGACSYINKNVQNNVLTYGVPGKEIRTRKESDPYLK